MIRITGRLTLAPELLKCLGASITGTAVHYVLLFVLVGVFTLRPVWASSYGAVAGAVTVYTLNYFYAFRSNQRHTVAMTKFGLVASVGLMVNGAVLSIALDHLHCPVAPAQLLASGVQFWLGFILNRIWTFQGGAHERQKSCFPCAEQGAAFDHRPGVQRAGGNP